MRQTLDFIFKNNFVNNVKREMFPSCTQTEPRPKELLQHMRTTRINFAPAKFLC